MDQSSTFEAALASIRQALAEHDTYAAVELLSRQEPALAASAYDKLQRELYWERKDVRAMVSLSRAGIQHGLTAAGRCDNPEEVRALRGGAKTLAYNLASFTWPGWGEPGITLAQSDVAVGLDAARLNLRLAEELDRPAKVRANALWLLGAHRLAIADHRAAAENFEGGKALAVEASEPLLGRMFDGYLLLTRLLAQPEDEAARHEFDEAVSGLTSDGDDDAKTYGDQLLAALTVFRSGADGR